jgi:DNA-directed RNA polymerase
MQGDNHVMSDHALVRYIERVLGGDIKAMKDKATPKIVKEAVNTGATSVVHEGVTYVIKQGKIVTIQRGRKRYAKNKQGEIE